MKWMLNGQQMLHMPIGKFGFVYLITHIPSGKIYVGKKNFKKGDIYESDWRTYKTSSNILKPLIEKSPNEFKAEVIDIAITSKQLGFLEHKWQVYYNVFDDNGFNRQWS